MEETVHADVDGDRREFPIEEAYGLLCAELNTSMSEILALEGKWTPELLATMLPVAVQRRAERNLDQFVCLIRGIMTMFSSNVAKEVLGQHEDIQKSVLSAMRMSRNLPPLTDHPGVNRKAKAFMDDLDSMMGTSTSPNKKRTGRRPGRRRHGKK